MFRHPKYYKELRKRALDERNKSDQAISLKSSDENNLERATGPGLKLQAATHDLAEATGPKQQATSPKHQASSNKLREPQASSGKHQAPSTKAQA